jgi:pimeloyl-ACP methyl ester carboxylesterase
VTGPAAPRDDEPRPTVVLLHGLGRTALSLASLRRAIEAEGFPTWSRTYPSRRASIPDLAATVAGWIREDVGDRPVVAVTHSLGGLLVRHMAKDLPWQGAVMLAPPNAGSRLARALRDVALFRWFFGPAGHEVAIPDRWPDPPRPCAVVAGTRRLDAASPPSWLGARVLEPGVPNDGVLTVDETRLPLLDGFAAVDASHTWIMNHPEARRLVLAFLESGRFPAEDGERVGGQGARSGRTKRSSA